MSVSSKVILTNVPGLSASLSSRDPISAHHGRHVSMAAHLLPDRAVVLGDLLGGGTLRSGLRGLDGLLIWRPRGSKMIYRVYSCL